MLGQPAPLDPWRALNLTTQGLGSLVNCSVILILMALLGQTRHTLEPSAARTIIVVQARGIV